MIKITHEFATVADAIAHLNRFGGDTSAAAVIHALPPAPQQPVMQPPPAQAPQFTPAGTHVQMPPGGDTEDEGGTSNAAVDSEGVPWDARIHAENRSVTKKGAWKRRKNVLDEVYNEVTAQLKASAQQHAPQQQLHMPQQPMQPPPPAMMQPQQPVYQQQQPMQPMMQPAPQQQPMYQQPQQQPMMQPAPQQQPVYQQPQAMDFGTFMATISQLSAAGRINGAYLAAKAAQLQAASGRAINGITDLMNAPDLIPYAVQLFQADRKWV